MSWVLLTVMSALVLGGYDLLKKTAVRDNAVLPVLFLSVVTGAAVWAPLRVWSALADEAFPWEMLRVEPLEPVGHLLLFAKSALVGASWVFSYFAVKHLPVSIAGPIRATSPLWTILIAVAFLGESPTAWQWAGVGVILISFYAFSLAGRLEGIRFHRDKWVGFLMVATLLSSLSAIFDKYLLQGAGFSAATVQCWFSIYLVLALMPLMILWWRGRWPRNRFEWRWSIPLIGLSLLLADFLYFSAIGREGALISVISPLRRASVLVTFVGGVVLFREEGFRLKLACLVVLLIGVILLNLRG